MTDRNGRETLAVAGGGVGGGGGGGVGGGGGGGGVDYCRLRQVDHAARVARSRNKITWWLLPSLATGRRRIPSSVR